MTRMLDSLAGQQTADRRDATQVRGDYVDESDFINGLVSISA
jgi:hypothetical protein